MLVCGFLLSLVYPGNVFYKKAEQKVPVSIGTQVSSPVLKYPHTEFEINGHARANAAGHSHRIQGGLAFLSPSHAGASGGYYFPANNFSGKNISVKEYLAHIYPSHNYW